MALARPTAGARREPGPRRPRFHPGELARHLVLALLVALTLFPIYFVLANSLKDRVEFAQSPLTLPLRLDPTNYLEAWARTAGPLLNSTVITVASVALILTLAALSAFAFALLEFPGRRVLFTVVFALLLVPGFLTLIPLFLQIKRLPISSGYLALILPYAAAGQAFSIFVLKSFFENIPRELVEAARIDGASDLSLFSRIVLPLSRPILVSVGIVNLVPLWNDYLLPSLLLDTGHRTVTMALVGFLSSSQSSTATNYGALMAAYALSAVPLVLLFSFLMRAYIEGLTSGSVKG